MRHLALLALALALLVLFAAPTLAAPPPNTVTVEEYVAGRSQLVAMAFAPDGRLFYTEKGGFVTANASPRVMTLSGEPGAVSAVTWLQLTGVDARAERGLLGIALDPEFQTNGYVYIFYTNAASPRANRVVRYTEQRAGPGTGTADPSSALILMEVPISDTIDATHRNHNGGNIHFGPDGYLYVTHGELGKYPAWAQDLTVPFQPPNSQPVENSAAPGKIHRIDARAPYRAEPNAARAPTDNPFYDDGNPLVGNDDRIWTYGHRNSFDFTFDRYDPPGAATPSNYLFATENGPECNDEVIRVVKGYNYRWPLDYDCPNGTPPQDATGPNPGDPSIPTLAYYTPPVALSGISLYTGTIQEWEGDLFFCSSRTSALYHAEFNAGRTAFVAAPEVVELPDGAGCSRSLLTGPDGALYFATHATIYRVRLTDPLGEPTALTVGPLRAVNRAPTWLVWGLVAGLALTLGLLRRARR